MHNVSVLFKRNNWVVIKEIDQQFIKSFFRRSLVSSTIRYKISSVVTLWFLIILWFWVFEKNYNIECYFIIFVFSTFSRIVHYWVLSLQNIRILVFLVLQEMFQIPWICCYMLSDLILLFLIHQTHQWGLGRFYLN